MWTPKRVVLLLLGFSMFLTVYIVYAFFLGGIDGLPPLPENLGADPEGTTIIPTWTNIESEADRKLRQAFGPECPQVQKAIRLEIRKKGMVLAADNIKIEPDGRVKLTPFSVALFGKEKPDQKYPEINTIESEVAFLTFEQPITNLTEIGTREIIGGELKGKIHIVNNRASCQKSDDLEIRIDDDPSLFYSKRENKIWTESTVLLEDLQTRPSTKITGKGMDLYLAKDSGPNKSKSGKTKADKIKTDQTKPRGEALGGVEVVVLRSWVEMHLYPDSGSGFLGGPPRNRPGRAILPRRPRKKPRWPAAPPPRTNRRNPTSSFARQVGSSSTPSRTSPPLKTWKTPSSRITSPYFGCPFPKRMKIAKTATNSCAIT